MQPINHLQDFLNLDDAHLSLFLSNLKYQLFQSHLISHLVYLLAHLFAFFNMLQCNSTTLFMKTQQT